MEVKVSIDISACNKRIYVLDALMDLVEKCAQEGPAVASGWGGSDGVVEHDLVLPELGRDVLMTGTERVGFR